MDTPNDLFRLCQSPGGKPCLLRTCWIRVHTSPWHSRLLDHGENEDTQFVREQVSKGTALISALDIFGESLLGVFSKRTQTPSCPWEGEAKLPRRSVSMNCQGVCYTDLLTSNCGVAGQGIQALSKRMACTDQVPAGSDWHASERQAQEEVMPSFQSPQC